MRLLFLAIALGDVALLLAQGGRDGTLRPEHALLPAVYTGTYLALVVFLRWKVPHGLSDPVLLSAIMAVSGIGLAAVSRIDPLMGARQVRWFVLGVAGFAAAASLPVWGRVRRYRYTLAVAGLLLLAATAAFGVEAGGARSWLQIGSFRFQPIEIVKILLVLYLAAHLAEGRMYLAAGQEPGRSLGRIYLGPMAVMALLFVLVLVAQRDLGGALLLFGLVVAMLYAATGRVRYLLAGGAAALAGAGLAVSFFDHVRVRFAVWLDPWSHPRGYQVVESLFAMAAGGIFGTGFGFGMADRIPAVETDFIYALITEELGFVGAAALLFLLAVICLRSLAPAGSEALDDVERLGTAGFSLLMAMQAGLIVAGVTRALPVTGVTLPLVSYGGSSLVASFLQLGLVYNCTRAAYAAALPGEGTGAVWSRA